MNTHAHIQKNFLSDFYNFFLSFLGMKCLHFWDLLFLPNTYYYSLNFFKYSKHTFVNLLALLLTSSDCSLMAHILL